MPRRIIMRDFCQNKIDLPAKQKTLLDDCTLVDLEEPKRELGNLHTINLTAVVPCIHA